MGALYVVEGSTLGGIQISRALAPVFGMEATKGAVFSWAMALVTAQCGARCSIAWRKSAGNPAQEAAAIDGAITTFLVFENWMDGSGSFAWEERRNGCRAYRISRARRAASSDSFPVIASRVIFWPGLPPSARQRRSRRRQSEPRGRDLR